MKLVRGLVRLADDHDDDHDLTVVCNVGDNIWLHGLYICPDIDTIVYGLAGILDTQRGWGIREDTFEFMNQLELLGGESWFRIGDKDLATHLARTKMLGDGRSLLEITRWICSRLNVKTSVIPATDDHVETRIITDNGGRDETTMMHLQEFWVKYNAGMRVKNLVYSGAERARPLQEALDAISSSSMVLIAPANPVSSIGAMLAIKGLKESLEKSRRKCVAISPIIGNAPVSGPAAKYMESLGLEVSPYGVAEYYSRIISRFVIHSSDAQRYARRIEEDLGIAVHYTNTIMKNAKDEARLASYLLALQKSVSC